MKLYLKRILVILILLVMLSPAPAFAQVTLEEAQEVLISYSVNFAKSDLGKLVTWYDCGSNGFTWRNNAYVYGASDTMGYHDNRLYMDCVGWTNFAVHYSTGLDCGASGSNTMSFAAPKSASIAYPYFDYTAGSSGYKPGDLIVSDSHIMIYVGKSKDLNDDDVNDLIVHSAYLDHLGCESLSKYTKPIIGYYRFNAKALDEMDKANFNYNGGKLSRLKAGKKTNLNMSNFYYNGIPDGKYSVTKSIFERIIESIAQIFDFLVGLLTMIVRMVFVGWAAIAEKVLNFTLKSVTGGGKLDNIPVTATEVDSGEYVSIEKIVFNQISIFDVNFFNFND